jgi:predicted phage terminase large subunit-like protein
LSDTSSTLDSSKLLASLLDGTSTPEELRLRLSELSPEEKREILNLSRRQGAKQGNARDFIEYVFADHLENGDGFLPGHILELIRWAEERIARQENGLGLEPRGFSKSQSFTIGKLTHLIAEDPHIRIGLMSNTDTQAYAFSAAIRDTLEQNERFIELYGDCVSRKKWTDAEWLHKDSRHVKDRTVFARGVGGAIVSKRFDLIVCDDILDEENTATPEQIEKVRNWFWKTLYPCLVPGGVILVIGTRWADGDFYEELMSPAPKGKGWRSLVVSAEYIDANGERRSRWPDRFPLEVLDKMALEMGSALYACAMLNDVTGLMRGNIFPAMSEHYYFDELPPGHYTIRIGIDLASSIREEADFTARVISAEDDEGNFWVLSAYRDKRESHHAEFVNDGYLAYPDTALVVCENNQFQSTLIQEVMRLYPQIPIVGRKTDVDKVTRARAVAAKYEAHKVRWHSSLRDSDFAREHFSFPRGHDDFIDAEGLSMDMNSGGFFFGSIASRGMPLHPRSAA